MTTAPITLQGASIVAKRKKSTPPTTKKADSARRAKQAAQELREFYQLGLEVLAADKKNPRKGKYSLGVSVEIAARIGMSRDYVDKARKFASTYTKAEFRELCALRRPDGTPLGPRHVIGLLRITDKRHRKRLQREAAREGWSTRRVAAEVSRLLGTAGSGGRQAKAPADVEDALGQIITMSNRWSRWYAGYDLASSGEKESGKSRIEVDDLPESIRKPLKAVSGQIRKLKTAVEQELRPSTSSAKTRKRR